MIKIDKSYDDYFISGDSGYPGGKAKDASSESGVDGTKWAADWFNTILGFFQALIVEALGQFTISGNPDRVGQSDLLNAVKKIIDNKVNPAIAPMLEAIAALQGPNDGHLYGRKNRQWEEIIIPEGGSGGPAEVIEALKLFSNKQLMITNAAAADRRLKRYDVGLPFLSPASEVYHFDTDTKNQNQGSSITIGYTTAPALVGITDSNGQIYLNPAVSDEPPYEPNGRSLYGRFDIKTQVPDTNATVEFWFRAKDIKNLCAIRVKSAADEELVFITGSTGIEYSVPGGDGIAYSMPGEDGIPYSIAGTTTNRVEHNSPKGKETSNISGVALDNNSWIHVAAAMTATKIAFYIGTKKYEFSKHFQNQVMNVTINVDRKEINIDELNIDRATALDAAAFNKNTADYLPYGALDVTQKWAVLMFDNPNRVATNLFESEQFKAAVLAAINNSR